MNFGSIATVNLTLDDYDTGILWLQRDKSNTSLYIGGSKVTFYHEIRESDFQNTVVFCRSGYLCDSKVLRVCERAVQHNGSIICTLTSSNCLSRFDRQTLDVTVYSGVCDSHPNQASDGNLLEARYNQPSDLVVDEDLIYVSDMGNNRIVVIDAQLGIVQTVLSDIPSPVSLIVTDSRLLIGAGSPGSAALHIYDLIDSSRTALSSLNLTRVCGIALLDIDLALIIDDWRLHLVNLNSKEISQLCTEESRECHSYYSTDVEVDGQSVLVGQMRSISIINYTCNYTLTAWRLIPCPVFCCSDLKCTAGIWRRRIDQA